MPDTEPFADPARPRLGLSAQILAAAALLVVIVAAAAAVFVLVAGRADGGVPRVVLRVAELNRTSPSVTPALALEALPAEEKAPSDSSDILVDDASETIGATDEEGSPAGEENGSSDSVALLVPGAESVPEAAPVVDSLPPAPDPALVSYGRHGPLPVIAPDGRKPLDVYARPFDKRDRRPRIAIVVGGLGLSRTTTEAAIAMLPPAVTLSFTPYAKELQRYLNAARAAGHEAILELPMEPFDYPHNDPGPFTLLTETAFEENESKLEWLMSRLTGYAGVVNEQGEKLVSASEDLRPILKVIAERGLYFLDRGTAKNSAVSGLARPLGLPFATSAGPIDAQASREAIEERLQRLEGLAREKGSAIGTGYNYPVTIERVRDWAETLEKKGLVLAPVSALLSKPKPSGAT